MSFIKAHGNVRTVEWYPKTASTALAKNSVVSLSSGFLVNSTSTEITGIILRDVVSTDSDYALTNKVPVELGGFGDIYEADVITGSAAATNVGVKYDTDTGSLGITLSGTTNKTWLVVGVISATKVLVKAVGQQTNDVS